MGTHTAGVEFQHLANVGGMLTQTSARYCFGLQRHVEGAMLLFREVSLDHNHARKCCDDDRADMGEPLDTNKELGTVGWSNVVSGLTGGFAGRCVCVSASKDPCPFANFEPCSACPCAPSHVSYQRKPYSKRHGQYSQVSYLLLVGAVVDALELKSLQQLSLSVILLLIGDGQGRY